MLPGIAADRGQVFTGLTGIQQDPRAGIGCFLGQITGKSVLYAFSGTAVAHEQRRAAAGGRFLDDDAGGVIGGGEEEQISERIIRTQLLTVIDRTSENGAIPQPAFVRIIPDGPGHRSRCPRTAPGKAALFRARSSGSQVSA